MERKEGVYRTRDSLKNFYIRVELRRLVTSVGVLQDTGQLTTSRSSTLGQHDGESWVYQWQEKVFSQYEEEVYCDEHNCTTPLQSKYHRNIRQLRSEGGRPNSRLFSYVDNDCFNTQVDEISSQLTDSSAAEKTFVSQHSGFVRRRHVSRRADRDVPTGRHPHPINNRPSEEERLTNRIVTPPSQSMYLMADLRKMDGHDLADEHVLCHITVNSCGVVSVDPDFNHSKHPYRIENRHHEVFEYRLEHVSDPISDQEAAKEKRILSELYSRHSSNLLGCVGATFLDPLESNALRVMVFGEIVCAEGFEYDDLYITSHLELPEFWLLESGPDSPVITQISKTRPKHMCNVAYFSCPLDYELHYHNPTLEEDCLPQWPRILVEVSSLDYWDRHRIEGYGYLNLPNVPGKHCVSVPTWRPCGARVMDKMKRFFVGGGPELDDISYVAQPKDFKGTHLSKYGFRTETSGTVKLRFNIIHQSSAILERTQAQEAAHSLKYQGFKSPVAAVLDAYQRAKDRAAATLTASAAGTTRTQN